MNEQVANIIKVYLKDLPWVQVISGLAKAIRVKTPVGDPENPTFVTKLYPAPCMAPDVCSPDALPKVLIPDISKRSIVYFEDGGVTFVSRVGNHTNFVSRLKLVVWLNTSLFSSPRCNITALVVADILRKLPDSQQPFNMGGFTRIQITLKGEDIKSMAIFGRYNYDGISHLFIPPYDYFALNIETLFSVDVDCMDAVTIQDDPCIGPNEDYRDPDCPDCPDPNVNQGPQGFQGAQGAAGPQGPQGDQGGAGADGSQGPQGFQGSAGAAGPQGSQGAVGSQGNQGFQGSSGAQGAQGPQGNNGSQGPQGDQGAQGSTGAQGSQGNTGATGAQGAQGAPGAQGSQGTQGNQGSVGAQGPQGNQGVVGATGAQGPQGTQGSQGNQGAVGSQGSQGDQGAQGPQGSDAFNLEVLKETVSIPFTDVNAGTPIVIKAPTTPDHILTYLGARVCQLGNGVAYNIDFLFRGSINGNELSYTISANHPDDICLYFVQKDQKNFSINGLIRNEAILLAFGGAGSGSAGTVEVDLFYMEKLGTMPELRFIVDGSVFVEFKMTVPTGNPIIVNWGDGSSSTDTGNDTEQSYTHTYATPDPFVVSCYAAGIYLIRVDSTAANDQLLELIIVPDTMQEMKFEHNTGLSTLPSFAALTALTGASSFKICSIPSTVVSQALIDFDATGATGVNVEFKSQTVTVNFADLTGAGQTAHANLISKGWTIGLGV